MSGFSVKKPFTVLVAVIAVLVLGVVSYLNMTPDLLPNMDFPYVMIMTTYPGASPEKVEQQVTKPLEQSMSTLEHIVEVSSTSSENYSMVVLEFEESVNMDTIGVDIQQAITALQAGWDDMVGTPYVLKINPSMLPVEVAAVTMKGMDTVELTEFLNETIMNKLEGITGVAQVSASGMITQELHVVLDQEKIDALNATVADLINDQLDEAAAELTEQLESLRDARQQLEEAKEQLAAGKEELANQTAQGEAELGYQQGQLVATKGQLRDQAMQLQSGKTQIETILSVLKTLRSGLQTLETEANAIYEDLNILLHLQEQKQALEALRAELEKKLEEIRADGSLSPEEIEAAIAELKNSPVYAELEAAWAKLQAELAARGLTPEDLEEALREEREALDRLLERMDALEGSLGDQGFDADTLDTTISQMEDSLIQDRKSVV